MPTILPSPSPTDRGPLPEGRDRQDDAWCARSPTCCAGSASTCCRSTSTRRATSPTTSTSIRTRTPTIGEVLAGRARAVDAIHKNMIPANLGLAEAELVLAGKMGRELTLKRALSESRRQHDVILIDCPPALGLLTVNALVAATHALVSAEGEYFSLQGVEQVLEVMELGARQPEREPRVARRRPEHGRPAHDPLARGARQRCARASATRCSRPVIRKSIRYPESAERGVSILDYRPELGTRLRRARRRGARRGSATRRRASA